MTRPSVAVILTHNRPELLRQCYEAIGSQVGHVLVIDNASTPAVTRPMFDNVHPFTILRDEEQPPNLSRLWNRGFDWAAGWAEQRVSDTWDVAVLCDDAIVPAGWFPLVADGMRKLGAAIGCTHSITATSATILKLYPDGDIMNRMPGWAFVVAGEKMLRADERMRWWWGDSDIDYQARLNGGTAILPGPVVPNMLPNDFTVNKPELTEQAGRDGETFAAKWGGRPW